jgi:hypothetical protein
MEADDALGENPAADDVEPEMVTMFRDIKSHEIAT